MLRPRHLTSLFQHIKLDDGEVYARTRARDLDRKAVLNASSTQRQLCEPDSPLLQAKLHVQTGSVSSQRAGVRDCEPETAQGAAAPPLLGATSPHLRFSRDSAVGGRPGIRPASAPAPARHVAPVSTDDACTAWATVWPARRPCAPARPPHVTGSTSTRLQEAVLRITVMDRLTCKPVRGAGVQVAELTSVLRGRATNAGSTKQSASTTDARGRVRCTLLSNRRCALCERAVTPHVRCNLARACSETSPVGCMYRYAVTATRTGYHPVGYFGEHILVTMTGTAPVCLEVPMIPVRVDVVLTIRELLPYDESMLAAGQQRLLARQAPADGLGVFQNDLRNATVLLHHPNAIGPQKFLAVPVQQHGLVRLKRAGSGACWASATVRHNPMPQGQACLFTRRAVSDGFELHDGALHFRRRSRLIHHRCYGESPRNLPRKG